MDMKLIFISVETTHNLPLMYGHPLAKLAFRLRRMSSDDNDHIGETTESWWAGILPVRSLSANQVIGF